MTADRIARTVEALKLRERGLTYDQIADRMGISRSYACVLVTDSDGSKARKRKDSYRGTCKVCGASTDGSNGRSKAPSICSACCILTRPRAEHGTRSKYVSGCRCEPCRAANRVHAAHRRGRPAPTHGRSGYFNYACRCGICRRAGSKANAEYHARRQAS